MPLLPPFPDGAEKLEAMRTGLRQEDTEAGRRALRLLDTYAAQEERLFGSPS